VLLWAFCEDGKTHARASAPDHAHYAAVTDLENSVPATNVGGVMVFSTPWA
jgi:hypothetical protein